jgi:nucleotide-binding universal stress UspA family protein
MVDVAVRSSSPEGVLAEESRTAALLVLAASSGDPEPPGRLDRTAAALLRLARCPVLLARPSADGEGVVVGVDGSPRTRDVLHAAMTEACVRSTTLTVVSPGLPPAERRVVASYVLDLRAGHPTVPVALRSAGTDLTAALETASSDAALVVVGRALDPAAPSSKAAVGVAGRASCPVLVVPCAGSPRDPDRGAARRSAVALTWSAESDDPAHPRAPRRQGRRR